MKAISKVNRQVLLLRMVEDKAAKNSSKNHSARERSPPSHLVTPISSRNRGMSNAKKSQMFASERPPHRLRRMTESWANSPQLAAFANEQQREDNLDLGDLSTSTFSTSLLTLQTSGTKRASKLGWSKLQLPDANSYQPAPSFNGSRASLMSVPMNIPGGKSRKSSENIPKLSMEKAGNSFFDAGLNGTDRYMHSDIGYQEFRKEYRPSREFGAYERKETNNNFITLHSQDI